MREGILCETLVQDPQRTRLSVGDYQDRVPISPFPLLMRRSTPSGEI